MSITDFTESLRDRARFALIDREMIEKDDLQNLAREKAEEILGESDPEMGNVNYKDEAAEFIVDGLLFRIQVRHKKYESKSNPEYAALHEYEEVILQMRKGPAWVGVETLADVGRVLKDMEKS